ncbi:PH domain-containing protein, partial [Staphylococcus argenteus]|nr:PH domain-containing protein [Staphylococcus argenteus]
MILLIVLSNIYSVTKTFIKYGEFELFLNSKDIHTTWGTFSKNNNTISKNHISAFILKASYLQQAFKINQLSVINMDSSKEK